VHRNAEYNAVVGERGEQNRGVGTAATRAMVRHGFFDLNLHRIYVSILRQNLGSIRMCEKAGFKEEGTIREGAYKNGQYHDLVLMGVLRAEVKAEGQP
jgi:RimJ/RimL family protein N-acetyltransferase